MASRRRRGGSDGGGPNAWDGTWDGKVLDIIYGHYRKALVALPLEDMPALAPRLLDAGICFGFADPVTNIIANTLCLVPDEGGESAPGETEPGGGKKRKRKSSREARAREEVLSKIVAGNSPSPPEARTIAERSLVGLVSFLISYFRHLPTRDALRYLCLARADLLVAVRLIEVDRCHCHKDEFRIRSHAKAALKCAAQSARLPNVDAFLISSFAVVSHLKLITQNVLAACRHRLSIQDISTLSGLLKKPFKLKKLDFAVLQFRIHGTDASIEKVPGWLADSLRGVLMDRIHDQYLRAIPHLPAKDFRIRHHRGLLKAGYCYGPFSPISNIIVNTIWYDAAFPAQEEFEVDLICTLRHVECRSLNGLIAFVLASIPNVSEHEAMTYLLKNNLKICKVIRAARKEGCDTSGRDYNGYKAAADASSHPKPEAYLEFVVQSLPMVRPVVMPLLKASHMLSSSEVHYLSRLLSPSSANFFEPTVELSEDALEMLSNYKNDFLTQQSFVCGKVKAALQNYGQTEGNCYELCIICGVNDNVGKQTGIREVKHQYSHVNFWAKPENGTNAILFFAQFCNDGDSENHQSFCYPLSNPSTHARCCYCEFQGIRIVHPAEIYWEGASDFEKVACGEHSITYDKITSRGKLMDNRVGILQEDYIYLDPAQDAKLIQSMNRIAQEMNLDWEDAIKRSRQIKAVGHNPQQAQ